MGKAALLGRVPTTGLRTRSAVDGGHGAQVRGHSASKTRVKRAYGPPYLSDFFSAATPVIPAVGAMSRRQSAVHPADAAWQALAAAANDLSLSRLSAAAGLMLHAPNV